MSTWPRLFSGSGLRVVSAAVEESAAVCPTRRWLACSFIHLFIYSLVVNSSAFLSAFSVPAQGLA